MLGAVDLVKLAGASGGGGGTDHWEATRQGKKRVPYAEPEAGENIGLW